MEKRKIVPFEVNPIGLGCMNLSHAYGHALDDEEGIKVIQEA